jgi:hypothetical protein
MNAIVIRDVILNMLYHPNSPYYRQFLSASARQKKKTAEMVVNQAQ